MFVHFTCHLNTKSAIFPLLQVVTTFQKELKREGSLTVNSPLTFWRFINAAGVVSRTYNTHHVSEHKRNLFSALRYSSGFRCTLFVSCLRPWPNHYQIGTVVRRRLGSGQGVLTRTPWSGQTAVFDRACGLARICFAVCACVLRSLAP